MGWSDCFLSCPHFHSLDLKGNLMQRYRIWHGDISISSTRLILGGQCCRMTQDVTLPLQNSVLAAFCPGQAMIFHVRFFRILYRQWQCAHAEFPTGCQVHCVENWSRLPFVYASKHWHSLTQKSTCIEHAVWICYPVRVDTHLVKETTRCSISKVWWKNRCTRPAATSLPVAESAQAVHLL